MTPAQQLRYHLAVLLVANGRRRVVAVLAELLDFPEAKLEAMLDALPRQEEKRPSSPKKQDQQQLLESLANEHPEKADLLRALAARLSNKTFLGELREVRQFLDRHSQVQKAIKARADALPHVLRVLASLDIGFLRSLEEQPDSGQSGLGVISDHIMGRDSG